MSTKDKYLMRLGVIPYDNDTSTPEPEGNIWTADMDEGTAEWNTGGQRLDATPPRPTIDFGENREQTLAALIAAIGDN